MQFVVGQRIKFVGTSSCCSAYPEEEYIIQQQGSDLAVGRQRGNMCTCKNNWQLMKNISVADKLTPSSLITLAVLGFLGYAVYKKESKK